MEVGQVEFSIHANNAEQVLEVLNQINNLANSLDGKVFNVGNKHVRAFNKTLGGATKGLADYDTLLERRTRQIAQWGSRMQTLGNGLQRVSSPFMNVFRGITMGVGYRMLGKALDSITGAFSRYDTMRTYANVLNEIGINANTKFRVGTDQARTAIENLEKSVLGLPTGLDEIVASMRVYAGITNDVEKATKMAIAANNAFIAGNMDETRTRMAERQLQNLLSNGELTAQQWNSLQKNMPLAFNAVGKEIGYTNDKINTFLADLKTGKVTANEFVDAFIRVGTEGPVEKAAQKMKMTWNAVSQNITNAFNRMGANILSTIDEVFEATTGRDFLQTVLGVDKNGNAVGGGIKDFIDGISESIQKFIRTNPDAILNFFNNLKAIDWGGMLAGYGDVLKVMSTIVTGLGRVFGGRHLIIAMAGMNAVGKAVSMVGALGRGLAKPIAKLSLAWSGISRGKGLAGFITTIRTISGLTPELKTMSESLGTIRWTKNRLDAFHMMQDTQVALKKLSIAQSAVNFAGIYVIAHAIKVAAQGLQELGKVKFSAGLVGNLGIVTGALTLMTKFAVGLGQAVGMLMKTPIGMAGVGGTLVVEAVMLGIAKSFELFGRGVKNIAESVKLVNEVKDDLPTIDEVREVVDRVKELAKAFSGEGLGSVGKWIDAKSIQSQMKAVKDVAGAMKSIKTLGEIKMPQKLLTQAKKNFRTITDYASEIGRIFDEREKGLYEGNTLFRGKKYNGKGGEVTPYARLKEQIRDYGETISGIAQAMAGMGEVITNIRTFEKKYAKLTARKGAHEFDWSSLTIHIDRLAESLYPLVDRSKESSFAKLAEIAKALKGGNFDQITSLFNEIPKMLTAMGKAYTEMGGTDMLESGKMKASSGKALTKIEELAANMGYMLDAVGRIREHMPEDMTGFRNDMALISKAFTSMKAIITKITTLTSGDFAGGNEIDTTAMETMGQKIGTVVSTLSGQLQGAVSFQANAKSFSLGLNSINAAIGKMGKLEFSDAQATQVEDAVKRIKQAINKINGMDIKPITKKLIITFDAVVNTENVMGQVGAAITGLKVLIAIAAGFGAITQKVSVKLTADISENVVSAVKKKIQSIRSQIAKLDGNITKNIHVNVTASATVAEAAVNAAKATIDRVRRSIGSSTGGYITGAGRKPIYRAHGGDIFKPRGTDTVPAMLTPGEYVMRRKAVDTFGTRFFQGLNHLDLKGALNSLSIRAGQNIKPRGNTVINNKTINNTNKPIVNIHEHNANGNIGLQRAGRWAHGLA